MRPLAIVTGATGGIGFAISRCLAKSYAVVGTYNSSGEAACQQWISEMEADARLVHMDIADHESTTAVVEATMSESGTPEVLVNCAGIAADRYFSKMSFEEWERVIRTNLMALFSVTQPVYRKMCEAGKGSIINISSVNGERGQAGQANYCAAKAGMHGFTMALAREAARFGVRVNTVSPGYTATPMVSAIREDVQAQIISGIPTGRFAEPAEIAAIVELLASEKGAYFTGANLHVNGGLHIG